MNKKNPRIGTHQAGFTIIELLIATLVFSVILLITTYAIIQISRTYIRGYISSETQNTNRAILDQLTQAVQLSSDGSITIPSAPISNVYWFCVDGERYTYTYNVELQSITTPGHTDVFIQDKDPGSCLGPASLTAPVSGSKELLSQSMQLIPPIGDGPIISKVNSAVGTGLYSLNLNILYGDLGAYLVNSNGVKYCVTISVGGAFCANSTISTTVEVRTTVL
jgi:prepilin-type N-terminal cleavage/methylation domain-containing protein